MRKLNPAEWVALVLIIVGALNWGMVGVFGFNLVAAVFGEMSVIARIVYILVGLSGLGLLIDVASRSKFIRHERPQERPA